MLADARKQRGRPFAGLSGNQESVLRPEADLDPSLRCGSNGAQEERDAAGAESCSSDHLLFVQHKSGTHGPEYVFSSRKSIVGAIGGEAGHRLSHGDSGVWHGPYDSVSVASLVNVPFLKGLSDTLTPGGVLYNVIMVGLIIFFCYFYTAIMFNPDDVAENMKKSGGYVPGIRPGANTAAYMDRVLSRLTLVGGIYVSIICVIPMLLITQFNVSFYFGGTSILIVVGVALDTVSQIESHLLTRNYDGLLGAKGVKMKGRRG